MVNHVDCAGIGIVLKELFKVSVYVVLVLGVNALPVAAYKVRGKACNVGVASHGIAECGEHHGGKVRVFGDWSAHCSENLWL